MTKKLLSSILSVAVISIGFLTANAGKTHTVSSNPKSAYLESTLGVNDLNNNENVVKVFPNPTMDVVNINFSNLPTNVTIVVYDLSGKKLLSQNLSKATNAINVSDFNNGVYVYTILNVDGKSIANGKFSVVK